MWVNGIGDDLPEARQAFASLTSVLDLQGEVVSRSKLGTVERVLLDGRYYFVKKYFNAGDGVANFSPVSKARREWQNLQLFQRWGLPAVDLAAYGEVSYFSRPRTAALVTLGVDGSDDLKSLFDKGSPKLQNAEWVDAVMAQVAHATRVMHQHRFAHNDWKWRNILVRDDEQGRPEIFMIDCPSGMSWINPFFEYRRIKDLACLDKVASKILDQDQRLRFYKMYTGSSDLTAKDHKVIAKVQGFFKGRE
ncbi:MAG: lipopolysaccharide kinase InaA family protein [Candidatus Pelagadaptatus aseana]|uniref:lipopolysaccharide kinase InaA family protein n=1 Tax=Candidatus Pelagadaptatus aseana TaxID=3120508 RepID=UPI0039B22124